MRMFPRDEEKEVPAMVAPHPSVDAALVQAVDTVARRLVIQRASDDTGVDWGDFPDIGQNDWDRIEARAAQLVKDLDRGQGPFDTAYNLLKQRAEHEQA